MSTTGRMTKPLLPLIGAQLSTAGGFAAVPRRAEEIEAEAVQVFNTNPRVWRPRIPKPGEIGALVQGLSERGLRLFFHSSYLINLASADDILRSRSAEALAFALATGALAQAEAVVTHVGSHRGEAVAEAEHRVVEALSQAVGTAERMLSDGRAPGLEPDDTLVRTCATPRPGALPALLLETGNGGGNTIGGRLEELAALLHLKETVGLARELPLGICLDTAHLFAAGYPVHEAAGLEDVIAQLHHLGLLHRVRLVHLNDTKKPFGTRRDEHENPGDGLIGYEGLARVVRHPALVAVPFILEVPGSEGHGPDAGTMAVAKSMRAGTRERRRRRGGRS